VAQAEGPLLIDAPTIKPNCVRGLRVKYSWLPAGPNGPLLSTVATLDRVERNSAGGRDALQEGVDERSPIISHPSTNLTDQLESPQDPRRFSTRTGLRMPLAETITGKLRPDGSFLGEGRLRLDHIC
jgi:hypothetical protein